MKHSVVKDITSSWCLPDDALIQATMATQVPYVVFEVKLAGEDVSTLPVHLALSSMKGLSERHPSSASFFQDVLHSIPPSCQRCHGGPMNPCLPPCLV